MPSCAPVSPRCTGRNYAGALLLFAHIRPVTCMPCAGRYGEALDKPQLGVQPCLSRPYQVDEPKAAIEHPLDDGGHLVNRVQGTVVVATLKLDNVAVQVLLAHPVVHTLVAALHECPERFQSVRVGLFPHVFANTVIDGLVRPPQTDIGPRFVRVNGGDKVYLVDGSNAG